MGMLYEYDEPEPANREEEYYPPVDPSKWAISFSEDGDLTATRGDKFVLTAPDEDGNMEFGIEDGDMWWTRYHKIHFEPLAAFVDYHRSKKAGS